MINKLILQSRVSEINTTTKLIIDAYNKVDLSSDAYLSEIIINLSAKNEALSAAIMRDTVDSDLFEKDGGRDQLTKTFNHLLLGFYRHPNTTYRTAALAVKKVFDKYGVKIIRKSYVIQTSLLESLLFDLNTEQMQLHIAQVPGLSEVYAALQVAQVTFTTAMLKTSEERSKADQQVSATKLKKEVCDIVNKDVVLHLRAMLKSNIALYGNLSLSVATLINTNNTSVKNRRSSSD